ncbi:MAG TPA: hypothetical protein VGH87_22890 [Polyangiaceae bacterium]|jgi:hypothetical protein
MKFPARAALIVIVCAMASSFSETAPAARSLRVRGATRLFAHAGRAHGHLLLEGRVTDDAGLPVPSAALAVSLGATPVTTGITACGSDTPLTSVHTDESGRFCVWVTAAMGAYDVHVDVAATELLAASSAKYDVDLTKQSIALKLDPEPRVIALDGPVASLDAIATYDDQEMAATGLPLELSTETGDVVTRSMTARGGRATFIVDPKTLGPPGRGALRVRFAGGDDTMASEHVALIERQTHVTMALAKDLEPASAEDGVPIAITTALAVANGFATGSVEARLDGVIVGAATLENGKATIHASFVETNGQKSAALQVRYVPDAPWLQPSSELTVRVPLKGPSPWRQAPLAVGALAVAAWLLVGRSARRQRLDKTIVMQRPPTHEGTAGISVVHSSRSRTGKYGGCVVDAHDGTPVARARVSVQVPSFPGTPVQVVVSVFADDAGEFAFDLETSPPQEAELVVEAPLHVDLRQKLPAGGVLEIAVVSRRRKLLERLVGWARRRGPPYDVRPEPTPGQVRRAAEGGNPAVAEWAGAVEQAAFDAGDVDARVEADVNALDPDARPPR